MFIFPLSVSSFVILFCLLVGLRAVVPRATELAPHAWLPDLGAGLLSAGMAFVLALGLTVTLVGIPLALLLISAFVVLTMVAMALSLPDVGDLVQRQFPRVGESADPNLARPLVGAGALLAISLIPLFGWLMMALYSWIATGRLVRMLVARYQVREVDAQQVHRPANQNYGPMSIIT